MKKKSNIDLKLAGLYYMANKLYKESERYVNTLEEFTGMDKFNPGCIWDHVIEEDSFNEFIKYLKKEGLYEKISDFPES